MKEYSILITDDQAMIRNIIVSYFMDNNFPYQFYLATDGEMAYKIAKLKLPDLIIMDWELPKMDGIETIKLLKRNEATKDIPVVMITGAMNSSKNLQTAFEAGAIDYIRKPIDLTELVARIHSALILSNSLKELKKKNYEIDNNNRFITMLIDTIPNPLFYYDDKGICNGCNQSFRDILNRNNDFIIGHSVYSFFIKDSADNHFLIDKTLLQRSQTKKYETFVTHNDNIIHDYIFTKSTLTDTNNNIIGIVCIMIDVTEINSAKKLLYNQELLLHKQESIKLKKELDNKKEELASNAIRLIQNSELNAKMVKEFSELNKYILPEGKNKLRELIAQYKSKSNEKNWQEFELHFEQVHKIFYQKLIAKYPDLSPNDRKLCAFLRLNLSSKEIASITYQSMTAIEKARYRLRKKLNLPKDENLTTYLVKF